MGKNKITELLKDHKGLIALGGGSILISLFLSNQANTYWWNTYGSATRTGFQGRMSIDYSAGTVFGSIIGGLTQDFSFAGSINSRIFMGTFFISLFTCVIAIMLILASNAQKKAQRDGHEHGKARMATKQDFKDFENRFADKNGNDILFSKNVRMSMDNRYTNRTTNVLVIGGTGTGKTFRYIKPNLSQLNASRIITDPSGDLYRSFAPYFIEQGKTVYFFNVSDMTLSNHFNPLLNVYDAEGNIDPQKVDVLVDLYMENASEGNAQGGSDPFWPKSEKAFITGVIYYVLENDKFPRSEKCFNTVLKKVQDARADTSAGKGKDTETKLTKEIKAWQTKMESEGKKIMTPLYYDTFLIAPEKTANTILITTAVDLQIFSTPGVDRITRYNEDYPDMNIDIDDIASTETYVFLGIPQAHDAYNFLISMFYSQVYQRLYDLGERVFANKWLVERAKGFPYVNPFDTEKEAKDFVANVDNPEVVNVYPRPYINGTQIFYMVYKNKVVKKTFAKEPMDKLIQDIKHHSSIRQNATSPELPMMVQFMLDEFKNIGEIPNFQTIISTSRKYRIGSHVVIQDIAQLKELYPDDSHQTIIANVDTILFLGSNLIDDKEFIQKSLGKTTIKQRSVSAQKSGNSISYTPTEVDVLSIDEIGAINQGGRNDAIVIIRDITPFLDEKLNYLEHPNFKAIVAAEKRTDPNNYFKNTGETQFWDIK